MHYGYQFGFGSGGGIPTDPVAYLSYLLAQHGVTLTTSYLLLGDSTTDLVAGATHTLSGGALVGEAVDATTKLVLSSPLVRGRFVFPAAADRLDADDISTLEVGAGSGLVVTIARYTARATTSYCFGKRETPAPNDGWEVGLNDSQALFANVDVVGGGAPMGASLSRDEAAAAGWRAEVWYRDASRDLVQIATTEELGDQKTIAGDLTSPVPFSLGAVRGSNGTPGLEVVLVAGWLGAQVEGLFGDSVDFRPNELGLNLSHHIALPIFADVAGAIGVGALI